MARNLESMLDAVLDGVVLLDTNGKVEFLNPEACRILETSTEAALGVSIDSVVGAEHPIARLSRSVLASGRAAIEREQAVDPRSEGDIIADISASPLLDGHTVDGVALMLRDCAIQNGLQEIVAQREALSTFGRIAAGIAHEVKNPLGGIRGAAEILASRTQDTKSRDIAALASLPRTWMQGSQGEVFCWIATAGAVEHLEMEVLDYIPGYRSPAGTGCGLAFARWL